MIAEADFTMWWAQTFAHQLGWAMESHEGRSGSMCTQLDGRLA